MAKGLVGVLATHTASVTAVQKGGNRGMNDLQKAILLELDEHQHPTRRNEYLLTMIAAELVEIREMLGRIVDENKSMARRHD